MCLQNMQCVVVVPFVSDLHQRCLTAGEDVLQVQVLRFTVLTGLLWAVPEVQVLGTGKSVRFSPNKLTQPDLGHTPHICPCNGPADHWLPACLVHLLWLANGSDFVSLLFHLHNFWDHKVYPFLLGAFKPHLKTESPSEASSAWLRQPHNLSMFKTADGLLHHLHRIPLVSCTDLGLGVLYGRVGWVFHLFFFITQTYGFQMEAQDVIAKQHCIRKATREAQPFVDVVGF